MENMTKALLMAAGILIIVMLLSAVMIFWDKFAIYFSANTDSKILEQLVEFNNKFTNYDQKTIRGNELISIMNRIIDYNNYQSDIVGYSPIAIEIDFINMQYVDDYIKFPGGTVGNSLINNRKITNDNGNDDSDIIWIVGTSTRLVSLSSEIPGITDTKLQKLSASISNIVNEPKRTSFKTDEDYDKALWDWEKNIKDVLGKDINISDRDLINNIKSATYQYYQYTQFKRAMFKCKNITYNQTNGRVNRMKFEVVLEDNPAGGKQIKFD